MRRYSTGTICRRLSRQAWPYRWHLAGVLGLSFVTTPLLLLQPLPLKIAVDSVIGNDAVPAFLVPLIPQSASDSSSAILLAAVLLLVGITLLIYLRGLVSWVFNTYTGEMLTLDFRARLFQHAQSLSLSYHDRKGSTDSTYRIQYDACCIQQIAINGLVPMMTSAVTILGMVVVTLFLDWELALISMAVCPVLFLLVQFFGRRLRGRWKEVKALESDAMAVIQEVLSSARVVKAFGREKHEQKRFIRFSDRKIKGQVSASVMQGWFDLSVGLTIAIGTAAVLWIGISHVQSGRLTLGSLLMVMAYLRSIYEPLRTVSKKLTDLQSGLAGAERAFTLLDEVPEVEDRADARSLSQAQGRIRFDDISFGYDERHTVLRDVCFEVLPGQRVGIQGETGVGKTTLISLLMRFYEPSQGRILLDGVDLRDYRLADLRNQFAIVLQEPLLLSTTIEENIAYGKPDAKREEVIEAAKLANAHDFVMGLPDGYQTEVGERGMRLSGGERQRVSLARAFLRNAPVLILDEPTSSVDYQTETLIMEATERLMEGRTTFIIAHRLSTLDTCDKRLLVRDGSVLAAESGVESLEQKTEGAKAS